MEYGVWSIYSFLRDLQEGKSSPFHCNLIPFSELQRVGSILETTSVFVTQGDGTVAPQKVY